MIRSIAVVFLAWIGLVFAEASQDEKQPENFRSYASMAEKYDAKTKTWKPGTYFVLVSAEWCVPCKGLKSRLADYPKIPIHVVDLDEEPTLSKRIMQNHKTVPCLIRYDIHPKLKTRRTVFRYGVDDLDSFLAFSVLEISEKKP